MMALGGLGLCSPLTAGAETPDNLILENDRIFVTDSQGGKKELPEAGTYLTRHALADESTVFTLSLGPDSEMLATANKSEKDWEDFGKQRETEITVEVPAAG